MCYDTQDDYHIINFGLYMWFVPRCSSIVHLEQLYEKDDKAPIVGSSSYKEHGFRMLMIWASGLNPDVQLVKELCDALSAVDKKAIAGNSFFYYSCVYIYIYIPTNFLYNIQNKYFSFL